jgi:rhodanese-related sulfurtransferase/DNA-binding transcriptional ArsR family regulator
MSGIDDPKAHREFKNRLYGQLARLGKSLASPHRVEFLELLAQSERTVESLADETGLSLQNASQHLKVLRGAGLVESRKEGLYVHYRLADPEVFQLVWSLRSTAEARLGDLERIVRQHFGDRSDPVPVSMDELLLRAREGEVVILDTRPTREYASGHIAGALSVPVDDLRARLKKLPKNKEYVAYCRGPYCVYADRAVEILRSAGREARRLEVGFPEWRAAGGPTVLGPDE